MNEIWKNIPNYDGLYQVSNFGNVKSFKNYRKGSILKPSIGRGYLQLQLCKNSKSKTFFIHKLVSMAFLNHIPCKMKFVINHINFNKLDNRIENLEIVTHRENSNKKHIKSSSQYTGVHFDKSRNNWRSYININKKRINLGRFKTELEAHNAYEIYFKNNIN